MAGERDFGAAGGSGGSFGGVIRGFKFVCDSWKKGDYYAEGYAVSEENSRME